MSLQSRKKNLSFVMILAASASIAMSADSFAAGDGHGFNGPDLSPVSIPVQMDRLISDVEMNHAISTCMVWGDPASGLKSLANRIYEAIYDTPMPKDLILSFERAIPLGSGPLTMSGQFKIRNSKDYRSTFLAFSSSGNLAFDPDRIPALFTVLLSSDKDLPYFAFSGPVDDSSYDKWGNLVEKFTRYQSVQIVAPANYKTPIHYINTDTKRKVDLEIDLTEYVECLQSQLQKTQ